jgi:hypothetical protein
MTESIFLGHSDMYTYFILSVVGWISDLSKLYRCAKFNVLREYISTRRCFIFLLKLSVHVHYHWIRSRDLQENGLDKS